VCSGHPLLKMTGPFSDRGGTKRPSIGAVERISSTIADHLLELLGRALNYRGRMGQCLGEAIRATAMESDLIHPLLSQHLMVPKGLGV